MATIIRKSPPICLGISLLKLILGKLRLRKQFVGQTTKMQDGQEFTIFRHITKYPCPGSDATIVFLVRFKFARLSHKANKIASIIPMLLITGYPGFNIKMYGVNNKNGFWLGMYQWASKQTLEEYKQSSVFRMMNKRAINSTLSSFEISNQGLPDLLGSPG